MSRRIKNGFVYRDLDFDRTEPLTYMKSDEKADKHEEKPEVCFVEDH